MSHHPLSELAARTVPGRVDAQRLDVDPLLVHHLQALSPDFVDPASEPRIARGNPEQRLGLRNDAMGVNVDRFDAPTIDNHLTPTAA